MDKTIFNCKETATMYCQGVFYSKIYLSKQKYFGFRCTLSLRMRQVNQQAEGFVSMVRICLDLLAQFGVKHKGIDVFQQAFKLW